MTRHLKLQTTSIICYTDKKDTLKLVGVVVVFEGSLYTREEGNGQRGIEGKKRGTGPLQRSPGGQEHQLGFNTSWRGKWCLAFRDITVLSTQWHKRFSLLLPRMGKEKNKEKNGSCHRERKLSMKLCPMELDKQTNKLYFFTILTFSWFVFITIALDLIEINSYFFLYI